MKWVRGGAGGRAGGQAPRHLHHHPDPTILSPPAVLFALKRRVKRVTQDFGAGRRVKRRKERRRRRRRRKKVPLTPTHTAATGGIHCSGSLSSPGRPLRCQQERTRAIRHLGLVNVDVSVIRLPP